MMLKTAFVMLTAAQMAAGFSMTGNRNLENKNSLTSIIEPQMKVSSTSLFMADTETVSIEDITAELNQHKQDFDAKVAAAESAASIPPPLAPPTPSEAAAMPQGRVMALGLNPGAMGEP